MCVCFTGDLDLLSEDYEAVDHRLQLFLDVVVFEEDEEELHSYLKVASPAKLNLHADFVAANAATECI